MKSEIRNQSSETTGILLIEDTPADADLIQKMLADVGTIRFDLECVDRLSTGLERLATGDINVVLLDLWLPDSQGLDTLVKLHAQAPDVPIVALIALEADELSVQTLHAGAKDCLVKGQFDNNLLVRSIHYAVERKKIEIALRESEARFRGLFEFTPDAVVGVNVEGQIILLNRMTEELFGYSRGELLGQPIEALIPERFRQLHQEHRAGYIAKPTVRPMGTGLELRGRRKDGSEFPAGISLGYVEMTDRMIVLCVVRDITHRKKSEMQIKASLREKEVLLKEVHHRVKNNLQVISSLLNLQSAYIKDPQALEFIKESRNRVRSMALVHQELYQSSDLARI